MMTLKIPTNSENIINAYHSKVISPAISHSSKIASYNRSAGGIYSPQNVSQMEVRKSQKKKSV